MAPGQKFTHRTETMDYIVILSGESDLELDGDEAVHLKHGTVFVQRGKDARARRVNSYML